jgi:hypothetical protein
VTRCVSAGARMHLQQKQNEQQPQLFQTVEGWRSVTAALTGIKPWCMLLSDKQVWLVLTRRATPLTPRCWPTSALPSCPAH